MSSYDNIYKSIKDRFDSLAKPIDGLGAFEDIVCRIGAITGTTLPDISKKALVIMCADNGVTAEGVTQTDRSVTAKVAHLMAEGKSCACLMAKGAGITVIPVDIGIDCEGTIPGLTDKKVMRGTGNIAMEPAMTKDQCLMAISAGADIAKECKDKGYSIIATGEMGIGNTTTSTALFCALTGADPEKVAGRGAGLSDEGLATKIKVIKKALSLHGYDSDDDIPKSPDEVLMALCRVGGLDIAGLTGLYKGCHDCHIPVVIDGAISAVAAFAAALIYPPCKEAMIASHSGREKITEQVLEILKITPVIKADLSLGEGTGAILLMPLLDMVLRVYNGLPLFDETDILKYERFDK